MCPFCLATAAMIAGSIAGTGGLAAALTGVILTRRSPKSTQSDVKEVQHGNNNGDCSNAA
jgi:hypothetical protein